MSLELESKVTVKLFVGCHLNSEIRMCLNQSKLWKQTAILPSKTNGQELLEVHFHGKDYFGRHLAFEKVTLVELRETENLIKNRLKTYCPEYDAESVKICIFPQVFVA